MHPCYWIYQGTRQGKQGLSRSVQGGILGKIGRLGFEAGQGHVRQNRDVCRTDLGQVQDRARWAKTEQCIG